MDYALWLFNWAFVATATTIVSGAVAERINFPVYIAFAFLLSILTCKTFVSETGKKGILFQFDQLFFWHGLHLLLL
jgi:ammonia channel protein AmtB